MRVDVPYGSATMPVEVDAARVLGVLSARTDEATDSERVLREALTQASPSFEKFLGEAPSPLVVVVNDATRPTPTAAVLKLLADDLDRWAAIKGHEISFAIATGTHRAATRAEIVRIVGPNIAEKYADRIFSHDAKDEDALVQIGRTSRGVDIWVNERAAHAGSFLLINSVEPHYFAGYTGGRKSLFPGLAGYQTVYGNHRFSLRPGSGPLLLDGNPVHEDLNEAAGRLIEGKRVFSIQLVLDKNHNVGFAAAGHLEDSFRTAAATADMHFVLDLPEAADVVVAVAPHPMDCNFYQTNKAIRSGALALKDGGILIVVSECPDGLGDNKTFFDILSAAVSPDQVLKDADRDIYRLGLQQATGMAAILCTSEIWVVSSLPQDQIRTIFMNPFPDIQSAVDEALRLKGAEAKVLFLLEASITVPRLLAPAVANVTSKTFEVRSAAG
jgi:lactate racemase